MSNGDVAIGGKTDPDQRFIEPTLLVNVRPSDIIMQEEIFGPILPFINISDAYEAIKFINERWVWFDFDKYPEPELIYIRRLYATFGMMFC